MRLLGNPLSFQSPLTPGLGIPGNMSPSPRILHRSAQAGFCRSVPPKRKVSLDSRNGHEFVRLDTKSLTIHRENYLTDKFATRRYVPITTKLT